VVLQSTHVTVSFVPVPEQDPDMYLPTAHVDVQAVHCVVSVVDVPVHVPPLLYLPAPHDVAHAVHVTVSVVDDPEHVPLRYCPVWHAVLHAVHVTESVVPLPLHFPCMYFPAAHVEHAEQELTSLDSDPKHCADRYWSTGQLVELQLAHELTSEYPVPGHAA
jgi:hypothetical protein